jgi:hypothetical protein
MKNPIELPAKTTTVDVVELICAFWETWIVYYGTAPKPISVQILTAQWALETGWGKACMNYNLGGVKSVPGDGWCWQHFKTRELLTKTQAKSLKDDLKFGHLVELAGFSDGRVIVYLLPPHPGSRFRAFSTLKEGAFHQLAFLARKVPKAIVSVTYGFPNDFCRELKKARYYTASLNTYSKTLFGCLNMIKKTRVDWCSLPIMSDHEKDSLRGLLALTAEGMRSE